MINGRMMWEPTVPIQLCITIIILLFYISWSESSNTTDGMQHYLDENSVVVITGAVGFLGSELAMALHRTYHVKKIICIDNMDHGFGFTKSDSEDENIGKKNSNRIHDLPLFEFKRQRLFRLLQTVGANAYFYRVDFRPSIPEYFDGTEIPVLHYIFTRDHPDITHVVHFADHYHRTGMSDSLLEMQVVPRAKADEKAGMMESILEQIRFQQTTTGKAPHFVYASSGDVYDFYAQEVENHPNLPPFREHLPITTPSTVAGTSKLLDEIIAQTYNELVAPKYLKSIGLRFFSIYGPWGLPGSPIFEMAETAVLRKGSLTENTIPLDLLDHVKDYCYIDDAIDAVMAAMQFEPPDTSPAIVFNVGSGQGTTLRSIAKMMNEIVSSGSSASKYDEDYALREPTTTSIANLDRINAVLGYQPQVSLRDGIEQTLAWQYDRVYPYGAGAADNENVDNQNHIANKGMVGCTSPHDTECLKGNAVFPCASECRHPHQCIQTLYDDVLQLTRTITSECTTVMYTVSLDTTLQDIPSVHVRVSSQSIAYVQDGGGYCNIAFVPDKSPLYTMAAANTASRTTNYGKGKSSTVKFGFWTLIPVAVTRFVQPHHRTSNMTLFSVANNREILELVPKLSPGLFFGSKVRHAIYCDMDVIFDSIPRLLQEANMQPLQHTDSKNSKRRKGATVMLIGKKHSSTSSTDFTSRPPFTATTVALPYQVIQQEMAYRTIRMALIDEMVSADGGFTQMVDSSFIVHNNIHRNSEADDDDSRLFRCDVLGEILQWNVPSDQAAIEFIMGLHDMWSRILVEKSGIKPWWIGKDVTTIPAETYSMDGSAVDLEIMFGDKPKVTKRSRHRRLQEIVEIVSNIGQSRRHLSEDIEDNESEEEIQEGEMGEEEPEEEADEETEEEEQTERDASYRRDATVDDDSVDADEKTEDVGDATADGEHNGFGVVHEAIQAVLGGVGMGKTSQEQQKNRQRKVVERFEQPAEVGSEENYERGAEIDDFVVRDDDEGSGNNGDDDAAGTAGGRTQKVNHKRDQEPPIRTSSKADPSLYDVWMGVLSSNTNVRYFSRIVSMQAVGSYFIDPYYDQKTNEL